jgi:hypothetical protein
MATDEKTQEWPQMNGINADKNGMDVIREGGMVVLWGFLN